MWFQNIFRNKTGKDGSSIAVAPGELLLTTQALRQLDRLQLNASRYLHGRMAGVRPSLRSKPAVEFRDYRAYVPGDDFRHIDWKASARQERIFIRQGEQPKDAHIFLLIDCSASMDWGTPSKRLPSLSLVAALGYLALAHGDRLTVLPYNETNPRHLGPISGKGQVPALLTFLRQLSFTGRSSLSQAVRSLLQQNGQGGLVVICSDLLDESELSISLQLLPAPIWDVVLIQTLHPEESSPTHNGNFEVVDIESGKTVNYNFDQKALERYAVEWNRWQQNIASICDDNNAFYTLVSTGWALDQEMLSHLRSVHLVRPL